MIQAAVLLKQSSAQNVNLKLDDSQQRYIAKWPLNHQIIVRRNSFFTDGTQSKFQMISLEK